MLFLSVADFKTKVGITSIAVVENPNTGKLFGSTDKAGYNVKVEQAIDQSLPIRFMYESEAKINEGCLVNVTPKTTPKFVL
jgi:hypothetical protein